MIGSNRQRALLKVNGLKSYRSSDPCPTRTVSHALPSISSSAAYHNKNRKSPLLNELYDELQYRRNWVLAMQHPETNPAGNSTAPLEWDRWLCEIEHSWRDQATREVQHKLEKAFRSVDPLQLHAFVLHLLDKSQDLRRMKPSTLALIVLKEFLPWVKKNSHVLPKDPSAIITDGMKLHALRLATSAHINLFDMICELYHLKCKGNEYLATHLRILLARKQFKEAGVAAYKLQLQHCFKIEEICLPLVFQDKVNLVEKYIQDSKEAQEELIQRLDSFCTRDSDLQDIIDKMEAPGVKKEKLRPKYLSKLILRLTKLFKLDPAICPNTNYHKDLSAVRFLMYKKYIEQSLDAENWDELIKSTIRDNEALQEEFINLLIEYNDPPAAAKWAVHYGIDRSKLAADVAGAIETCPPPSDEPDNWDDNVATPKVSFYQLSLPLERIVMVDNVGLLEVCERHIFQDDQLVGIDMEWTPSFTATQITRVALVQLATLDWVYLLDMITLMATAADRIRSFFLRFLSSSQVLKLGFGISGDFKMLTKSYPGLKGPVAAVQRMVDLDTLSKQILKAEPDFLKRAETSETDSSGPSVKGLSELTLMCFGRALDKKEQLSNWEKRPLRPSQAQYAALDAYCLLEIYTFLKTKVSDAWLDIDMEPTYCSKTPKQPKSKTKERKPPKKKATLHGFKSVIQDSSQPLRPGDLSVVCDTMLQGLGRQLRACGVDVKILETSDEHDEAARIAFKDGRVILTSGTPYQTLKSQVGEGKCLAVDTKCNARQQTVHVFEHFNVRVRQEDVFSRCQVCNHNMYVPLNNEDMKRLWNKKKELLAMGGIAAGVPASSEGTAAEIPVRAEGTAAEIPASSTTGSSASAKYLNRPLHGYDSDEDDEGLFLDLEEDFEGGGGDYFDIACPWVEAKPSGTSCSSASLNEKAVPSTSSGGDSSVPQVTSSAKAPYMMRNFNPHYRPPTDSGLERTVDFDKVTVGNNVQLQVEGVPEGIVEKIQKFFCCAGCGKVFWEGTHFERVVSQFAHVLDMSSELDA
ncbi:exonuclease mut-7 homolog isoform X2 [Patiria miniata]|uniref:3'-5' exonuclease domain-containing protein n=1 Tax=Patiria miniata TaxID=46514 RepID=A0A914B3R7_PATMI|nr:exonuclease mut-7 homolog isoform X2 [Patiria miniata]